MVLYDHGPNDLSSSIRVLESVLRGDASPLTWGSASLSDESDELDSEEEEDEDDDPEDELSELLLESPLLCNETTSS